MSFLHAHRRRVPAQDVYRSICVGVCLETTMLTRKACLAFAALLVDGSTFRTGLRGIGGVDLEQITTAFFELVGKNSFKGEPALVENASVQSGFLFDVAPRTFNASLGSSCHLGNLEVFENDSSIVTHNIERGFVVPVKANAGTTGRKAGVSPQSLSVTNRATLSARSLSLCGTATTFDCFQRYGNGKPATVRKRKGVGNTSVYAKGRADVGGDRVFNFASKTDVPAKRIMRNRGVFDGPSQQAGVAEFDPTKFRQAHSRPLGIQFLNLHLTTLKAKTVIDAFAPWRWILGRSFEEVAKSPVKITQSLLQAGLRDGSYPIKPGSQLGEFTGLSDVIEWPSSAVLVLPPPSVSLFQREIVDQATDAGKLAKQTLLLISRGQLITKATHYGHLAKALVINLQTASDRVGLSSCFDAHLSACSSKARGSRTTAVGADRGLPIAFLFFVTESLCFAIAVIVTVSQTGSKMAISLLAPPTPPPTRMQSHD